MKFIIDEELKRGLKFEVSGEIIIFI